MFRAKIVQEDCAGFHLLKKFPAVRRTSIVGATMGATMGVHERPTGILVERQSLELFARGGITRERALKNKIEFVFNIFILSYKSPNLLKVIFG